MNESTKNRIRRSLIIILVLLGISGAGLSTALAAGSWHHRSERVVRTLPGKHLWVRVGRLSHHVYGRRSYRQGPLVSVLVRLPVPRGYLVAASPPWPACRMGH